MELHDLKLLRALLKSHTLTHRDLAAIAGYRSHSYIGRLVRGQVKSLDPTPAARIAHYFNVDVGDLFVTRSSSNPGRSVPTRGRAA